MAIVLLRLKVFWNINKLAKSKSQIWKGKGPFCRRNVFFPNGLHNFLCSFHVTENKHLGVLDDYEDQVSMSLKSHWG